MKFAHLKRILRFDRFRLRAPRGVNKASSHLSLITRDGPPNWFARAATICGSVHRVTGDIARQHQSPELTIILGRQQTGSLILF